MNICLRTKNLAVQRQPNSWASAYQKRQSFYAQAHTSRNLCSMFVWGFDLIDKPLNRLLSSQHLIVCGLRLPQPLVVQLQVLHLGPRQKTEYPPREFLQQASPSLGCRLSVAPRASCQDRGRTPVGPCGTTSSARFQIAQPTSRAPWTRQLVVGITRAACLGSSSLSSPSLVKFSFTRHC